MYNDNDNQVSLRQCFCNFMHNNQLHSINTTHHNLPMNLPFWFRNAVASSSVISSSLDIPSTCLLMLPHFISRALRRLVRRPSRSAARLARASSSSRLRFGADGGQDPTEIHDSYSLRHYTLTFDRVVTTTTSERVHCFDSCCIHTRASKH
jgi:hypothetical protein